MVDETIKMLFNYGVPTAILGYCMFQAPRIGNSLKEVINRNTEVMETNTKVLLMIATKLDCAEGVNLLLKDNKEKEEVFK